MTDTLWYEVPSDAQLVSARIKSGRLIDESRAVDRHLEFKDWREIAPYSQPRVDLTDLLFLYVPLGAYLISALIGLGLAVFLVIAGLAYLAFPVVIFATGALLYTAGRVIEMRKLLLR